MVLRCVILTIQTESEAPPSKDTVTDSQCKFLDHNNTIYNNSIQLSGNKKLQASSRKQNIYLHK